MDRVGDRPSERSGRLVVIAIELLFTVVLVGAVPLGVGAIQLGDPAVDGWISRLRPFALPAAVALAAGLFVAPSPVAAVLAAPWQVLASGLALGALAAFVHDPGRWRPSRRLAVEISLGFLAFGATHATSFAAGFAPLGFAPTIVLLTAVHFHAAGFVLMTAGILAFERRPSRVAAGGVAGIAIGSVVTAAGFVGVGGAAVVGALTVAIGGLLIGAATLHVAPELQRRVARQLTRVAGAALFGSMPLAIGWAVGTQIGAPPFPLDVMLRTHGVINALVVCLPAMAGWALEDGR